MLGSPTSRRTLLKLSAGTLGVGGASGYAMGSGVFSVPAGELEERWHEEFHTQSIEQPVIAKGHAAVVVPEEPNPHILVLALDDGSEVWIEPASRSC